MGNRTAERAGALTVAPRGVPDDVVAVPVSTWGVRPLGQPPGVLPADLPSADLVVPLAEVGPAVLDRLATGAQR